MVNTLLRRAGIALLSGGLLIMSLNGCKNSDEIGLNLTPPGERFQYVVDSTAVVTASTILQDSLTTEKRATSLLGCMNDPIFGRSTASLMTQLRLSSNEVDFGVNPLIDSVVVLLKYKGYTEIPHSFRASASSSLPKTCTLTPPITRTRRWKVISILQPLWENILIIPGRNRIPY